MVASKEVPKLATALRHRDVLRVCSKQLPRHLLFELLAIDYDEDGGLFEVRMIPEFSGCKDHRQRFPTSLCVPNNPSALSAREPELECSLDDSVCSAKLLVAGNLLHEAPLFSFEYDEILDDVEQIFPIE